MFNIFVKIICSSIIIGGIIYLLCFALQKNNIYFINKVPKEERLEILRNYSIYQDAYSGKVYNKKIVLNNLAPDILNNYEYNDFIDKCQPESDELAFALMDFVSTNFKHDGDVALPYKRGMIDLIQACEASGGKTNCRGLALILAELLRINNIKARHVTCMPYEDPFTDCHVVVDCIMPSGKRIMLDPTYRLFLMDEAGEYVSIEKFREGLILGKKFIPCQNASYNGQKFNLDYYLQYMSKNLFRFSTNLLLDDSKSDIWENEIELVPVGYKEKRCIKKRKILYNAKLFWDFN